MDPNSILLQFVQMEKTERQRKWPCENGLRDWSYIAIGQEYLGYWKVEERRKDAL